MNYRQGAMFPDGDDLPLFSNTPQRAHAEPFAPQEQPKQERLPNTPALSWEELGKEKGLCQ